MLDNHETNTLINFNLTYMLFAPVACDVGAHNATSEVCRRSMRPKTNVKVTI